MRATLVVAFAIGLAACRSASEPTPDPFADLPRRSLAEVRASFPDPSDAGAFVFDGDVVDDGVVGRARIAVEPGTFQDAPAWFIVQDTDEAPPALSDSPHARRHVHRTAWLSADLFVLRSDLIDGDLHETAVANGSGAVVTTTRGGVTETTAVTAPPDGIATLAGAMLFFRLCPAERAAYGEPPLCPYVASVGPGGDLEGVMPTKDATAAIHLRGPGRVPVAVTRASDRIVARPDASK